MNLKLLGAVRLGNLQAVKDLCEKGADVNHNGGAVEMLNKLREGLKKWKL